MLSSAAGLERARPLDRPGCGPLVRALLLLCALALAVATSPAIAQAPAAPGQAVPEQAAPPPAAQPTPPAQSAAQPPTQQPESLLVPAALLQQVEGQRQAIDRLGKAVTRIGPNERELDTLRPEITSVAEAALATEADLKPRLDAIQRQIEQLGPAPKDGEAEEAASVKAERARLDEAKAQIEGAIKRASLTQERASQLLGQIQQLRLQSLARDLSQRRPSPLSPEVWGNLANDTPRISRQIGTVWDNWWTLAQAKPLTILLILLLAVGSYVLLHAVKQTMFQRRFGSVDGPRPRYLDRVRAITLSFPLLVLPAGVAAAIVYFGLDAASLQNGQVRHLLLAAITSLAIFVSVSALARTILLPRYPDWRLLRLDNRVTQRLHTLVAAIAACYALDLFLYEVFSRLHMPLSISIAESYLANFAFSALLFAIAWTRIPDETSTASGRALRRTLRWLRLPAALAVLAIVAATVLGYVALGRFIAGQVMLIGSCTAAALLAHLAIRTLTSENDVNGEPAATEEGEAAAYVWGLRRRDLLRALAALLNLAVVAAAITVLLVSWGISEAAIWEWIKSLLFGFEIGKFRFSLIQILIAAGLFAGLIMLTRLLRQWLASSVLTPNRTDRGIANSIDTGLGYAGLALAALVAVSYAGLDLSNLALIASALSIGIGFGLNAIASNFVSGLIMLIERPVKVGDWVVVGSHQGHVRRISVRATEIETFDRASVIIPNSEFMTAAVQNWTHRNAMGRVVVNIGASYNADPQHVMQVLQEVASKNEKLLKYPAPFVVFEEFGASSLDFSLRGYIADVNTMLATKTQLRLDIHKAFKEAGIEIPFPQQDVHLRDLDQVRTALAKVAAQRAERNATTITPATSDKPT